MNTISIPISFFNTTYDGRRHPQSGKCDGLEKGAHCQHFAYEILRYFGYKIGNLRSSDLWEDTIYTKNVRNVKPLDILFFNKDKEPYGAHVGVYLGHDRILHLYKEVGYPTVWNFAEFKKRDKYNVFIGAKRPKMRG